MTFRGATVALMIGDLSSLPGRTVVDDTALTGEYDFKLEWTPDSGPPPVTGESTGGRELSAAADGPSLFTAIQEQLGLKLVTRRAPVEFFIVDRAEKPGEN
jgi:uncharacterized protein (TIGR03435 family)